MNFLLILKMFETTQSIIATSLLWLSFALPSLVVGPFASAYTDLTDKRKILVYSNALQAVVVFVSAFFVVDNIETAYIFIFLYSVINQFYVPSEFSALPKLVNKSNYPSANGLFLITQQIAVVVGFTIAHSLENIFGFESTLIICATLLIVATISVWFLPKMSSGIIKSDNFGIRIKDYCYMIIEGFKFILNRKYIRYPFICLMAMSVTVSIITVNMPVIAQQIIMIPAESSGMVIALPVGIGAFIGAYFSSKALSKGVRKYNLIKTTLVTFILGLVLMTFSSLVFQSLLGLYISIFGIIVMGFGFIGIIIPILTYLQEAIPDEYRGRVFGNFWFIVTILSIIPVLMSGILSEYLGPRVIFVILITLGSLGFIFVKTHGETFIKTNFSKSTS